MNIYYVFAALEMICLQTEMIFTIKIIMFISQDIKVDNIILNVILKLLILMVY